MHEVHFARAHIIAAGIVGDDGVRHAVGAQLEGGERSALVAGPRFVHPDMNREASVVRHVDGRERGAAIDVTEPARVAMGENVERLAALLCRKPTQQFETVFADFAAGLDIFVAMAPASRQASSARFSRGWLRKASRMRVSAHCRLTAVGRVCSRISIALSSASSEAPSRMASATP